MATTINLKPYKTVYEGLHNGNCFELEIFRDANQWEVYWHDLPKDYPKSHNAQALYDEKIYLKYKKILKPVEIHTTIISHRDGVDSFIAKSEKGMTDQLYDYIKDQWIEEELPGKLPKNKQKAIEKFFESDFDHGIYLEYQNTVNLNDIPE